MVYKLTPLNFPSYFVKIISFNVRDRTFEVSSFQVATSTCRGMRNGVAQGGLVSPFLCSFYVKDIPDLSHHVQLAVYADHTTIIAASRMPALLVSYVVSYLSNLLR